MIGTEGRGALNAKAKRELGWVLRYPTWRRGFYEAYAGATGRERADATARAPITSPASGSR